MFFLVIQDGVKDGQRSLIILITKLQKNHDNYFCSTGLCYCEFASRIPRAGSAYVYIYLSIGELWAFVVGWNLILEDVIGAAAAGKAVSQYFDSMLNNTISK